MLQAKQRSIIIISLTYLIRTHLTGSIELIILIRIEIFIKWLAGTPPCDCEVTPIQSTQSKKKMKLDFPRAMFDRGIFGSYPGVKISHMRLWFVVNWMDAVWDDSLKIILEYFVDEFIDRFD